MVGYAEAASSLAGAVNRSPRPMDRIGNAADRVEQITAQVMAVLARFHNRPPADGPREPQAISVSYLSNLDRLSAGLEVLDKLTCELSEIA